MTACFLLGGGGGGGGCYLRSLGDSNDVITGYYIPIKLLIKFKVKTIITILAHSSFVNGRHL